MSRDGFSNGIAAAREGQNIEEELRTPSNEQQASAHPRRMSGDQKQVGNTGRNTRVPQDLIVYYDIFGESFESFSIVL